MHKFLFLWLFITYYFNTSAQNSYLLIYQQYSFSNIGAAYEKKGDLKFFSIINDSASYTRAFKKIKEPEVDTVGNDFQTHACYRNFFSKKLVEQRHPYDTVFLKVIDTIKAKNWFLEDRSIKKEILGYTCYKASLVAEDKSIITAWYTTLLPPNHSPNNYDGLPGTILEINDLRYFTTLRAVSIAFKQITIVEPTIGDFTTPDEWKKITWKLHGK